MFWIWLYDSTFFSEALITKWTSVLIRIVYFSDKWFCYFFYPSVLHPACWSVFAVWAIHAYFNLNYLWKQTKLLSQWAFLLVKILLKAFQFISFFPRKISVMHANSSGIRLRSQCVDSGPPAIFGYELVSTLSVSWQPSVKYILVILRTHLLALNFQLISKAVFSSDPYECK